MRLCRLDCAEWRRFASATHSLNEAEASFGLNLRDSVKANLHFLSTDPSLSTLAANLESLCDAIAKSNSSTVFINAGIDDLLTLQQDFDSRRSLIRDLDESLKKAAKTVIRRQNRLSFLPAGSENGKRCRVSIEEAVREEERLRLKLEAERSGFEGYHSEYQKSYVQTISTLLTEMSTTRAESETQTAQMAKQIAECKVRFSLDYPETDGQLGDELRQLRKIVDMNDRILSERLFYRCCSSDADLIVVSQKKSTEALRDESWEEDEFLLPTGKPSFSVRASQP
jgi:hypothetical protein